MIAASEARLCPPAGSGTLLRERRRRAAELFPAMAALVLMRPDLTLGVSRSVCEDRTDAS